MNIAKLYRPRKHLPHFWMIATYVLGFADILNLTQTNMQIYIYN